jgi:hypothetical protein
MPEEDHRNHTLIISIVAVLGIVGIITIAFVVIGSGKVSPQGEAMCGTYCCGLSPVGCCMVGNLSSPGDYVCHAEIPQVACKNDTQGFNKYWDPYYGTTCNKYCNSCQQKANIVLPSSSVN